MSASERKGNTLKGLTNVCVKVEAVYDLALTVLCVPYSLDSGKLDS